MKATHMLGCWERKVGTFLFAFLAAVFFTFASSAAQSPTQLGDLDADGQITILDLVTVINHIQGTPRLSNEMAVFADVNQDGIVNDVDVEMVVDAILGVRVLPLLPLTRILETSPSAGSTEVSVTRETIVRFNQPLSTNALATPQNFYAEFAGQKLVARAERAPDRRTLTLFYAYPLPGSARIRVTLNGNAFTDFAGRPIDADGDGQAGGVAIIEFDTLNLTSLANTFVCGRVFASQLATNSAGTNMSVNTPLAGVTVTADGLEQTVRAVTDQFGDFRLTNAPAGHFFVHVDGRTVTNLINRIHWPDLRYYPYVGKEWESVPGGETNIGEVFLPLIAEGTLHPVNPTNDTVITFPTNVPSDHPELQGVTVTVPANALFSDNGTRGGMVGIAPVPPDRLPGPLPNGLNFPLVITLQTDGPSNFGQPVPVCFPNLSITGQPPLPPGAKSALWSFNHDTGQWEIVGPMTVSDDGRLICSDPGVGILAPGWHGSQPGTNPDGGPPGRPPPCQDPCECGTMCCPGRPPRHNPSNPVLLHSGEKQEQVTDLRIKGVGMDFMWVRTYSSVHGPNTVQGNAWDFNYNSVLLPDGSSIRVCNGLTRDDLFRPRVGATNSWTRSGFFQDVTRNPDGSHTQVFPDHQQMNYFSFDGSPVAGKLQSIIDRNGNTLRFFYDAQGRLMRVNDTLNRDIQIAYNAQGFIESVTDFAGRSVRYTYFGPNEPGGSFGDLKSVTTPVVTSTPNGNDFPNGKTTTYTYTKGFADERLNHNLLTITDGRRNDPTDPTYGQGPYLVNVYAPVTNPDDIHYDRVIRQFRGGDVIDFTYVPQIPDAANNQAYLKVIVNDRNGNVTEHFYDAGTRLVMLREYTGRGDSTQPTTEASNRPTGKLRAGDPDFFETRCEYNSDFLLTRMIHPNGNITENVYESALTPNAPPATRGNLRIVRRLSGAHQSAGDQAVIEEQYDYDTSFGCTACGFNFVTKHTDARSNITFSQYDERGNLTNRIHRIASITERFAYNARGQMTSRLHPDNGSGHHRVDTYSYYDSGPQRGYLREEIIDSGGFNLSTRYEHDLVGNVVRKIAPRGQDTIYAVNALEQIVRETSPEVLPSSAIRYVKDYFYDANNNLIRFETQNRAALEDGGGIVATNAAWTTVFEYEILNYLVRKREEVEPNRFIVTEYGYDGNRNRTLTRFGEATAGRQTNNVVQMLFDERNLPFREVRAPGSSDQSTTQFDYDGNRNRSSVSHGLEDPAGAHVTSYMYDGYDRLFSTTDPMGNMTSHHYDRNGNRTNTIVTGELEDVPGSANNVRLSETIWTFDPMNRTTRQDVAFFNATNQASIGDGFATTQTIYSDDSQVLATINDNNHGRTNRYDTASRRQSVTDANGNTIAYEYDADSNPSRMVETEKPDLGGPDELFTATYVHDQLNRLISTTDNIGNINRSSYDSRNNRTILIDANTNAVRYVYDGLNRLTDTVREMTATGVGGSPVVDTIITRQTWDDTSRLTSQIDDNTNATTYVYDALNRKMATIYADSTGQTNQLDAHGNAILFTDANGNRVTNRYDGKDRLIRRDIGVGPGVSPDTTFEVYKYDGLNRLTWAEDNDSLVTRSYDSLGHVTREVQRLTGYSNAVVACVYNGVGNLSQCMYPGGRVVTTSYDALERKKTISDTNGMIAGYWFVGPTRVSRRDYGNGTRCEYMYDGITGVPNPAGDFGVKRMTHTRHTRLSDDLVIDDRIYTWDSVGNKTRNYDVRIGGPQWRQDYRYDSDYRLNNSSKSAPADAMEIITYNLDGVGNRTSVIGGTNAGSYTKDASLPEPADRQMNQYTTTPFGTRLHDKNGNLARINSGLSTQRAFAYDYANRDVGFTNTAEGVSATYQYDALGRRTFKMVSGPAAQNRRFLLLGWQEIEEQDAMGVVTASTVFGNYIDEVLNVRRAIGEHYFHSDQLFSVIVITGADGLPSERYNFSDYGTIAFLDPIGNVRPATQVENSWGFSGRRYEDESAFYYYRTRYLESIAGRFTSRDSIGIWGAITEGGNGFTYTGNNPASFLDPFGRDAHVEACKLTCVVLCKELPEVPKCEKLCKTECELSLQCIFVDGPDPGKHPGCTRRCQICPIPFPPWYDQPTCDLNCKPGCWP